MANTNAQTFYPGVTDQDQSWGTDVRKLDTSIPTLNSTTTCTFTSDSGPYALTVDPLSNVSGGSANDNRTNLGWAFNQSSASADAMGSTSTEKRVIPAGTWSFTVQLNYAATDSTDLSPPTIRAEWGVYRVATGGGTRTLLFQAQSLNQDCAALGAAGAMTHTVTSAQAKYDIDPGETIHVAMRVVSRASTALLFGAVTNTVVTVHLGTSAAVTNTVQVPAPGIRTNYIRDFDVTGTGTAGQSIAAEVNLDAVGVGESTLDKATIASKEFDVTGDGQITETHPLQAFRERDITGDGTTSFDRVTVASKSFDVVGMGEIMRAGLIIVLLERTATGVGEITYDRDTVATREYDLTGEGTVSHQKAIAMEDMIEGVGTITHNKYFVLDDFNITGEGTITSAKAVVASKSFDLEGVGEVSHVKAIEIEREVDGEGLITETHPVQAFRTFDLEGEGDLMPDGNKSKIQLDIDEVPTGGGGDIIIVKKNIIVLDD